MENKIAECLNLLALKTHTYNCDDCLKDIMEIIAPQQKQEYQKTIDELEQAKELFRESNRILERYKMICENWNDKKTAKEIGKQLDKSTTFLNDGKK